MPSVTGTRVPSPETAGRLRTAEHPLGFVTVRNVSRPPCVAASPFAANEYGLDEEGSMLIAKWSGKVPELKSTKSAGARLASARSASASRISGLDNMVRGPFEWWEA